MSYKSIIAKLPRVTIQSLKPDTNPRQKKATITRGRGRMHSNIKPRIGFAFGAIPFQKRMPKYGFYDDFHLKREYYPLTLWQLQNMIDLGRIDPNMPIDINSISNSRVFDMTASAGNYCGIYLLSQGADIFEAEVNIEVQIADDLSIAAVERKGGVITTSFYDKVSFMDLVDPVSFFMKGRPIRKRLLPPVELVKYYTDPKKRGYLSDPNLVNEERQLFALQYGYELPDISKSKNYDMLIQKKDPRQIFFGLSPGSLVNLYDKEVIKPDEEYIKEYYKL